MGPRASRVPFDGLFTPRAMVLALALCLLPASARAQEGEVDPTRPDAAESLLLLTLAETGSRDLRSELFVAIETKDRPRLAALLAEDPDIDLDRGEPSPLATATLIGDPALVALLLRHGADPNAASDSALLQAVRVGEPALIDTLLAAGAEVPGQSTHEELFDQASKGRNRTEIFRRLLKAGGDTTVAANAALATFEPALVAVALDAGADPRTMDGWSAFVGTAPPEQHGELIDILAGHGAEALDGLVLAAVDRTDLPLLDTLLGRGARLSVEAIERARASGDEAWLATVLERRGGDVLALADEAEAAGQAELAQFLRQRVERRTARWVRLGFLGIGVPLLLLALVFTGRRRHLRSPRRLHEMVAEGDTGTVHRMLQAGADPNTVQHGRTPLHGAAQYGEPRMVALLLRQGAAASTQTEDELGYTPLHLAALGGRVEVGEVLLRHRAEVDPRSHGGETPLSLAAMAGEPLMVEWLLGRGAEIERARPKGESLLTAVTDAGHEDILDLLLDAGADPNPTGGSTPLHRAAFHGRPDLVRKFLAAGADPRITDSQGRNAMDLADFQGHLEIVAILEDMMA